MRVDDAARARVNAASEEAFQLALDALHDLGLQEAIFRRLDVELSQKSDAEENKP
jgi:hypothetical protein